MISLHFKMHFNNYSRVFKEQWDAINSINQRLSNLERSQQITFKLIRDLSKILKPIIEQQEQLQSTEEEEDTENNMRDIIYDE